MGWLALLAALLPGTAAAADWKVTPRLSLSETFSDNVALNSSGGADGDFITQFNPGIRVVGEGARLKLHADYAMQNILYLDRSEANKVYHQLTGNAVAEILDEVFFIDARAGIAQRATSAARPVIATDNLNISDNISTVSTLSVSPYLKHRFGTAAVSELRYTREEVVTNAQTQADSSTDRIGLSLSNGPSFQRVSWRASYDDRTGSSSGGADRQVRRALLDGAYRVNSRFSLVGSAGYDDDSVPSTRRATSGIRWTAGLAWTPSTRMRLDMRYQDSYTGQTFTYSLTERTRHTAWQSSYSETVTTGQAQAIDPETFILIDPATKLPLLDETGRPIEQTVGVVRLADDTFISKRFQHSVVVRAAKNLITLTLFDSRRESLETGAQDRQYGGRLAWGLNLSQKTASAATGSWQRLDNPGVGQERELWSLGIGLIHRLDQDLSGSLVLRHSEQSGGSGAARDYSENRISASLTKTF